MSKALLKYTRLSPTKARLIAREIQGMNAELALATLEFAPNKAAKVIYKVLASAVANGNYDAQSVIVKSCRIDAGPVLRRMSPRARGRANMIRKPTSHILVEVAEAKATTKDTKGESKKQVAKNAEKAPKKVSKKIDSPKVSKDSGESMPKAKKDSKPKVESDTKSKAKKPSAKVAKTTTSEDK